LHTNDLLTFKTQERATNEVLSRRVYDVHQGEPYFRLIKFSDFGQLVDDLNEQEEEKKGDIDFPLNEPMQVHIVTPRGMVNSKRTFWNGDL